MPLDFLGEVDCGEQNYPYQCPKLTLDLYIDVFKYGDLQCIYLEVCVEQCVCVVWYHFYLPIEKGKGRLNLVVVVTVSKGRLFSP